MLVSAGELACTQIRSPSHEIALTPRDHRHSSESSSLELPLGSRTIVLDEPAAFLHHYEYELTKCLLSESDDRHRARICYTQRNGHADLRNDLK